MRHQLLVLSAFGVALALVLLRVLTVGSSEDRSVEAPLSDAAEQESVDPLEAVADDQEQKRQTSGPELPLGGATSDAGRDGVEALVAYGRRLGPELDFVKPWPDVLQLEELRGITLASGVSAAQLSEAASALDPGDPGRVALVAAAAWARDPSAETDGWLHSLAVDWSALDVTGEQVALAAVLALDLGGRGQALERCAAELMERSGGNEDSPSFEGLSAVRTWHALRGLPSVEPGPWQGRLNRWFQQDSPDRRVNEELWALAVRSSAAWADRALNEALIASDGPDDQRSDPLLGGVAALSPDSATDLQLLQQIAEAERKGWLAGAANKAMVRAGTDDSIAWVGQQLQRESLAREHALEALRTWRPPSDPGPVLERLAGLYREVTDDDAARIALTRGIQRTVNRLRFSANRERAERAASALLSASAGAGEGDDTEWAQQLRRWAEELAPR